jgi:hypothetical protein
LHLLVADACPVSAAKTRHDRTRAAGAGRTCLGVQHKRGLSFQLHGLWLEAPRPRLGPLDAMLLLRLFDARTREEFAQPIDDCL